MGLTQQTLEHHWAMDLAAAAFLAPQIDAEGESAKLHNAISHLAPEAIATRDVNRAQLIENFSGHGKAVAVLGACSMDKQVAYAPLFDLIQEIQAEDPDVKAVWRGNVSKPRSGIGWRGTWPSTIPEERSVVFDTYNEALNRGIGIVTEVTDNPQLGDLAPYLSGVWLGARDMPSTGLRYGVKTIQLGSGIKNGMSGDPKDVRNAIETIQSNSVENDGSGSNLGSIAGTLQQRGIATGVLPIGRGNPNVAIFARGYELPKHLTANERRAAAFSHLSSMCTLAEMFDCAVLIDGTHGVVPMLVVEPDQNRLLGVLREVHTGIRQRRIENAHRIRGIIGEVGPVKGRTDPNYIIDTVGAKILKATLAETMAIINEQ